MLVVGDKEQSAGTVAVRDRAATATAASSRSRSSWRRSVEIAQLLADADGLINQSRTQPLNTTFASLLERLRQPGSPGAWPRFVRLYTPLLHYWVRRTGFSDADADDLVQEVFAALVQKMPAFAYDKDKTFRGWLAQSPSTSGVS